MFLSSLESRCFCLFFPPILLFYLFIVIVVFCFRVGGVGECVLPRNAEARGVATAAYTAITHVTLLKVGPRPNGRVLNNSGSTRARVCCASAANRSLLRAPTEAPYRSFFLKLALSEQCIQYGTSLTNSDVG